MFRTYEPARDRLAAVKVFRLDLTPEQAEVFAGELRRGVEAGLDHPGIVRLLDAGVEGALPYLALEYVAAESLDVAMRHYAPALLPRILPFLTELAMAIDAAHEAGFLHGSLHPRDVFVTADEMRISGFGVASALERLGLRVPVRRPYSAPERVIGEPWGAAADVFSLAAVTYELLTGHRLAGTGDQLHELTIEAGRGVDAEAVRQALARALSSDPGRRPQRAIDFLAMLARAAGEEIPGADVVPGAAGAAGQVADAADSPLDLFARTGHVPAEDHADVRISREPEPTLFDVAEEPADDSAHEESSYTEPEAALWEAGAGSPRDDAGVSDDASERFAALDEEADVEVHAEEEVRATELFPEEGAEAEWKNGMDGDLEGEEPELLAAGAAEAKPGRAAMLPFAVTLLVGLLIGFVAGYGLGSRDEAPPPLADAGTALPEPDREATDGAPPDGEVAPPMLVDPPVIPTEVPPVPGDELPAPRIETPPAPEPVRAAPAAAPSPAPAPTPAGDGRLLVRSTPAGATVTIDGEARGETPLALRDLPYGTYAITIARAGSAPHVERITLSAGQPVANLTVTLLPPGAASAPPPASPPPAPAPPSSAATPGSGSVLVESRPPGARVSVDGRLIGTTPLLVSELPAGARLVRLELDGYQVWQQAVQIVAGERARVAASLERR